MRDKILKNGMYGVCGDSILVSVEYVRKSLKYYYDPVKPKKSIKAHSFIKKKDFSGGLKSLSELGFNYDYASLYPTR